VHVKIVGLLDVVTDARYRLPVLKERDDEGLTDELVELLADLADQDEW
jgi:hypothetical protein